MNAIAKFEKVSFQQFLIDWKANFPEHNDDYIEEIYHQIQLPKRATKGSAGYDFFIPCNILLEPKTMKKIPTGIRVRMQEGWVLTIVPRSSLGMKYRLQLNNTIGIIDSDYYNSDNEGHLFIPIHNDTYENKTLMLQQNDAFVQGIFLMYGLCEEEEVSAVRNGGFGSTTKGLQI